MISKVLLISFYCMFLLIHACTETELSREDEINQYIESGIEAAEDRSTDDLTELIDDSYLDDKAFNKIQLTRLIRLYFFRHKKIYLFTKIDSIEFFADNEALVTLRVAMAGSVISDVNALASLSADIYRFELELFKEKKWLLKRARWQSTSMGDLQ